MRKLVLLLTFGILSFFNANASHIAGGDLSYTCIGGNDYLITLSFYRDCSGITEMTTESIKFTSSCTGTFNVTLNKLPPINGIEVTPVCPGQTTTCGGGSLYGLEKFVYQGQVTLVPCADWVISFVEGNRNPSNTIVDPSYAYMYLQATLNNLIAPCNSSPTFSNPPSTIICNGQLFCYNHGAIDPDNDSLVYQLVTPYDQGPGSGSVYVTYLGGYSATQPLPSTPPVTIDALLGDICMTPTANITTVVAVLVTEWRWIGGVPTIIGTVIRDMQLTVISCTNDSPTLGGINPNATGYNPADTIFFTETCLGDTVLFNIYPQDDDIPADNLTLSWNSGIPDGTFNVTSNNTPNAVGHFVWIPNSSYVSNVPNCFTVNIRDDNCPYVGQQTISYCIVIKGMLVELEPDVSDSLLCMGENYTLIAHGDTNVVNYHWTINGNPVTPLNDSTLVLNSTTLGPGTYDVVISVDDGSTTTSCPGLDFQTITIVPQPNVNLGADDTICSGQTLVLDAGPGAGYFWTPGSQLTQTINVTATGVYAVEVDGGINTRCVDLDTIYIKVLQLPVVDLGPDLCVTEPTIVDAGNAGYEFEWTNEFGNVIGTGQTYNVFATGIYTVTVAEQLGYGCDVTDDIIVRVIPEPVITLGPDTIICQHQSIKLEVEGVGIDLAAYDYTYSWLPTFDNTPFIVQAWLPEGTIPYIVTVTGCSSVSDTLNLTVHICNLTIPNIITPNGDEANQYFVVPNLEYYPNSEFAVYNRWGKKIFESSNYQNDWDGGNLSDGVYYFVLKVNFGDTGSGPKIEEHHGTVTILR